MSAPLDFLKIFAGQLRGAGISFAITSGMACVHYGLQQTTKDSDWIIPSADLGRLRNLLSRLEGELPPWRVSYRQICGAPLEEEFMRHGWTSHLSVWDSAGSMEHKVDIFSKPPRVRSEEMSLDQEGWASPHVVAQMKKTDRDKDWPIVNGLGRRLWLSGLPLGLLHITDMDLLVQAWSSLDDQTRKQMAQRRPLLNSLSDQPALTGAHWDLLLLVERLLWERVNHQRYSRYANSWKNFYRSWRREHPIWPTNEPFVQQHARLLDATRMYHLPADPLASIGPGRLVQAAVDEILAMERFTPGDIASVLPPMYELLP
jgi:hypothetical protein